MARPVQNAAACRVDSTVAVLLFEPPAQPVQRSSSLRSRRREVSCRYHDGLNKECCARGKHARCSPSRVSLSRVSRSFLCRY